MAELNWSDAQWQKVNDCISEAFGKASVSSAFLPCYGPLPGSAETVRNERLVRDGNVIPNHVTVRLDGDHDEVNRKLVNLTVNVLLSSEQVADETLSNAMLAFRRAANILAQEQDRIVFDGFLQGLPSDDSEIVVNSVEPQRGLADLPSRRNFPLLNRGGGATIGQAIVSSVVDTIRCLEDRLHPAPFACVLGNELFNRVHDPSKSLVLPVDRVTPLLKGGPLLRSGRMDTSTGIVVSLAGNAVDIVVGTPPTVQLLQRTPEARFLFRVYERFVLRIRDSKTTSPVAGFRLEPKRVDATREALTVESNVTGRLAIRRAREFEELV